MTTATPRRPPHTAIAVAAACALLVLAWLVLADGAPAERVDPTTVARGDAGRAEGGPIQPADVRTAAATRESLGAALTSDGPAAADVPAPSATRDLTIRGVVLDPDGAPIAGARARAIIDLGFGYEDWDIAEGDRVLSAGREVDAAVTDSDGAFTLDPGGLHVVTVSASSADRPARSIEGCAPGAQLEIVLANGGTVEGSVTVAGEAIPVVDAEVRIFHGGDEDGFDIVRTDAAGRYRATGLHSGDGGVLVVPREYAMTRYAPFELQPGGTARVDVEVEPGWRLAGRVTDAATGDAVAGATVSPWEFVGQNVLTDERGDFVLEGVRERPGTRSVRADGYGRAEVQFEGPRNDLDVALRAGLVLRGRLVDAAGAPIAAAKVVVAGLRYDAGFGQREWLRTLSAEDGTFSLDSVRRDLDLVLQARATGFGASAHPIERVGANVREVDLGVLTLEAQATIEGCVLRGDGSPAARAGLLFRGPKGIDLPDETAFHVGGMGVSADDVGGFFVGGLAAGTWTVWLNAPGGRSTEVELTLAAGEDRTDVVLQLPGGDVLEGRVVDAADLGIESAFVMVEALESEEQTRLAAQCDATGTFRIEHVPAGRLRVQVSVPDDAMEGPEDPRYLSRVLEEVEADGTFLTVRLQRLDGTVSGVVVDHRGDPVPLAYVCVPVGAARAHSAYGGLADDAGRFELAVPSSGPTRVLAWRTGPLRSEGNMHATEWRIRRSIEEDGPYGEATLQADTQDARVRLGLR
ncbi:MAG: carboxypeptidase-like regulatory domain-containing protein [Planctomycetota bacterium]